jgi:hypothetical protein
MKAMGMAILCLALASAGREHGFGEEEGFPQFAAGEKRLEILSRIRNDLILAVKENRPDRMDSLLQEGDGEFGRRIWLSKEERLYLYLLVGRGGQIVREEGMSGIFWGETGFYDAYSRQPFPRLCPGESVAGNIGPTQLGYAPDLIDHLKDRFIRDREAVLERLKPHADVHDLVSIARCPDPGRMGRDGLTRSDLRVLEEYVRGHPDSRLTAEILRRSSIDKSWSGNGWLMGVGPAYSRHDEKTRSLLDDGFQGSLFMDFNFPLLKTGIDLQFRPFTPRRPFAFDDTVVSAREASFYRFVLHAGHSFRLARNAFLTPYTGIVFSELSLAQADEERLKKKDKSESSVGFPLGANLDYLFILPGQDSHELLAGFGLRLAFAWHRGNWQDMESGLGKQGAVLGLKVFYATAGVRRD